MKRRYRLAPREDGWRIEVSTCCGGWTNLRNSGPFGYNGAWVNSEWAIDMLSRMVWRAAHKLKPYRRDRRNAIMRIAKGYINIPRKDASK